MMSEPTTTNNAALNTSEIRIGGAPDHRRHSSHATLYRRLERAAEGAKPEWISVDLERRTANVARTWFMDKRRNGKFDAATHATDDNDVRTLWLKVVK